MRRVQRQQGGYLPVAFGVPRSQDQRPYLYPSLVSMQNSPRTAVIPPYLTPVLRTYNKVICHSSFVSPTPLMDTASRVEFLPVSHYRHDLQRGLRGSFATVHPSALWMRAGTHTTTQTRRLTSYSVQHIFCVVSNPAPTATMESSSNAGAASIAEWDIGAAS
jgi:hypothetical protein